MLVPDMPSALQQISQLLWGAIFLYPKSLYLYGATSILDLWHVYHFGGHPHATTSSPRNDDLHMPCTTQAVQESTAWPHWFRRPELCILDYNNCTRFRERQPENRDPARNKAALNSQSSRHSSSQSPYLLQANELAGSWVTAASWSPVRDHVRARIMQNMSLSLPLAPLISCSRQCHAMQQHGT